jgi:molecular chaperone GrpE (heat shock protein)
LENRKNEIEEGNMMRNPFKYYCCCERSKLEEGLNAIDRVRELENQLEELRSAKTNQEDGSCDEMTDEVKETTCSEDDKRLKLIQSLIKFRDQLLLFKENAETEEAAKLLTGLYRETGRFMGQNGIEVLNKGGDFTTDYQIAVETAVTDKKELVNTIESTYRDGYIVDGRMLRPQEVVVYVDGTAS